MQYTIYNMAAKISKFRVYAMSSIAMLLCFRVQNCTEIGQ